jgi:predicted O-linked N-acetylglucosamine transferase (SPINDLY family)
MIDEALTTAVQHHRAGRLEEAEQIYRQILQIDPGQADALHLLGLVVSQRGDDVRAIEYIEQAIRSNEQQASFHSNLARAMYRQGRFADSIVACQRALQLQPDDASTLINLGAALKKQGRVAEAIAAYERARQLRPDFPEVHNNLGNALRTEGRVAEAILCYERALQLRPDYPDAHNNLGVALKDLGRLPEAIACYERAVRLRPDYVEAYDNLGNALRTYGRIIEAAECYRRALQVRPNYVEAHSSLVYSLHFCPGVEARTLYEEHVRWDRQFAAPLAHRILPHANEPAPQRRLRIGYVSPDFRQHVVGRNLLPLFRAHDRREFEIVCYSGVSQPDALTDRFRSYAGAWHDVADWSDEQLAQGIRADRIDILVDLTLHMVRNRLLVFARKPAPIQVTFAGYPGTTGLSAIDYRLTDPYLDPPGRHDDLYAEESVRFFASFWCFDPPNPAPVVNPLPAVANGFVTFGCLNHFGKVNRPVLRLWAEVLRAVPGSRLLLLVPEGPQRQSTLEQLEQDGIEPARLTFVGHQPRQAYLEQYHDLDMVLDTFPYNGHTTSLEALWMGVPVVTLVGQTVVGRAGLSQLINLGLPELIAGTPADFVRIAVELAGHLRRLGELRATLRARMEASPLMDSEHFARGIEAAYRSMWQRWCVGRSTEAERGVAGPR